jgi:hypothetical protein
MTQTQLNRAVARATGESVEVIQYRGFSPMKLPSRPFRRPRRDRGRRRASSFAAKDPS